MTPEQYIDRNIESILSTADKDDRLICSYIQRICRIGYNQAVRTIDEMLNRGLIEVGDVEWVYRFKQPLPGDQYKEATA